MMGNWNDMKSVEWVYVGDGNGNGKGKWKW